MCQEFARKRPRQEFVGGTQSFASPKMSCGDDILCRTWDLFFSPRVVAMRREPGVRHRDLCSLPSLSKP